MGVRRSVSGLRKPCHKGEKGTKWKSEKANRFGSLSFFPFSHVPFVALYLMELEFDKEIDAILRKARSDVGVTASNHLDADMMAAFAENALPERAKLLCGRAFC